MKTCPIHDYILKPDGTCTGCKIAAVLRANAPEIVELLNRPAESAPNALPKRSRTRAR
jgi:hypothetical protein